MNIIELPLDRWLRNDPEYKYNTRTGQIKYIIMHSTGGIDSRDWLSKWNKKVPASDQNDVSIHYLVQRDGRVYKVIPEQHRAWHAGVGVMPDGERDPNSWSLGIELEHLNEPSYTDAQLDSAAELVAALMAQYGITGEHVVSHASVALPPGRKIDPVNFDWGDFWNRILHVNTNYSEKSLTMNTSSVDSEKLTNYIRGAREFKNYTVYDVGLILSYYYKYCNQVGVDYVFAISQMLHETGWLNSWWANRPRRNPAGIGVTGQTTTTNPHDDENWAQIGPNSWARGQSFRSWDIAVQNHISRLLCYALNDNEMTPEQLAFSEICGAKARLQRVRGVAKIWEGFNGTWAVPGKTYAQRIATIANSLVAGIS